SQHISNAGGIVWVEAGEAIWPRGSATDRIARPVECVQVSGGRVTSHGSRSIARGLRRNRGHVIGRRRSPALPRNETAEYVLGARPPFGFCGLCTATQH